MKTRIGLKRFGALLLVVLTGCGPKDQQARRRIDPQAAPHMIVGAMAALSGAKKGFFVTNGQPTYHDWNAGAGNIAIPLQGADADSFETFDFPKNAAALFARDTSHVYMARGYTALKIDRADAASFQLITPDGLYSRDAIHVYFLGISIDGADPSTFEVLTHPFSQDKEHAFFGAAPIPGIDRESWRPLRRGWVEEPWYKEHGEVPVPKLQSRVGGDGWSRDTNAFYNCREIVPGIDVGTFEVLSDYYARDKNHVYSRHYYDKLAVIKGADLATFVVHEGADEVQWGADAHDAKSQYRNGRIFVPKQR